MLCEYPIGILLSTYGTFWSTVGMGAEWPGGDYAFLGVLVFYTLYAFLGVYAVRLLRREVLSESGGD